MSVESGNVYISLSDTAAVLRNTASFGGGFVHAGDGLVEMDATDDVLVAFNQALGRVRNTLNLACSVSCRAEE